MNLRAGDDLDAKCRGWAHRTDSEKEANQRDRGRIIKDAV